jgi:hypothetical protein
MSRYYTKLRDLITVIIIVSLAATSMITSLTLMERANGP